MSQTEAVEAGLKLLLDQPQPASILSPEDAMRELDALARALADKLAGFDAEAAEEEGRD